MTYNVCTKKLQETFGIKIESGLSPSHRFQLAIAKIRGLIDDNKDGSYLQQEIRELNDFSRNEIRSIFEVKAIELLKKSKKRSRSCTREEFIRSVCIYLHKNCGMIEVKKLHTKAKRGIYHELNKSFKWLLKSFNSMIVSDGSHPEAILRFYGKNGFERNGQYS